MDDTYYHNQLQRLHQLIKAGEGIHLEFKRKAAFPEKIVREMIAFANTDGGTVLIGVSDDLSIPGLKYPEEESFVIKEALKHCDSQLSHREEFIPISRKKTVLRYDIFPSQDRSISWVDEGGKKSTYVRVADQSIKASKELREIIRRRRKKEDIKFHYGKNEQFLMKYLDEYGSITLDQFVKIQRLSRFVASRKLILLVLADVLKIDPSEKGDSYSLASERIEKNSINSIYLS